MVEIEPYSKIGRKQYLENSLEDRLLVSRHIVLVWVLPSWPVWAWRI